MKKLFYLTGLCLLTVTCKQTPDQLVLKATGLSETDDIYVYDMAENRSIDTIKIDNGAFTYTLDNVEEHKLLLLSNSHSFAHYIVAEKGNLSLSGDTGLIKGTPLNDRLTEFTEEYKNAGSDLEEKKMEILEKAEKEGRGVNPDEMTQLQAFDDEQRAILTDVVKKYYENDKGNALGVLQLIFLQGFVPKDEFAVLYEQGGEAVKKFPPFVKMIEVNANMKKTQAGGKYLDFEGVNPKDTTQTLRLSDFAEKDKYVLLDFWASWCGPCKAAMPELKKLNDKYSDKGLIVIGVVISDQIDAHLKTAEELKVTWTQIFDNKDALGSLYGITGIPTLILLDKDGTILVRTHDKKEIIEKIESLLGK